MFVNISRYGNSIGRARESRGKSVKWYSCSCYPDGCAAETTANGGVEYQWPETEIGERVQLPCSGTTGSGTSAYRECGGSYSQGAEWEEIDDCECRLNVDNTESMNTQELCEIITQVSLAKYCWSMYLIYSQTFFEQPDVERAEATVNLTANHSALTATDISGTVTVLESLVESASNNEEVQVYMHMYV